MANKPLKSIKFPGLTDTYTIPQIDTSLTVGGKAADAQAVGNKFTEVSATADNAFPTDTLSGDIVTFADGADDIPLKSCVVAIEPVQDLHGQEAPYPAGGSRNLFKATPYGGEYNKDVGGDLKTYQTMPYEITSDGRIVIDIQTEWRGRLFATDALTAGDYACKTYMGSENGRLTVFITDANLVVKSVVYSQSSSASGWSALKTVSVSDGDRIAVFIGSNTVEKLISEFQVESGTTLHDIVPFENICPISGWTGAQVVRTGVNVWDEEWEVGGYNINTGEKAVNNSFIRCKNPISVVSGQTYHVVCSSNVYAIGKDKDGNCLGLLKSTDNVSSLANKDILIPPSVVAVCWYSDNYGTTYNHDISINYPATDHDYHPYTGTTYPITFPSEAGTVYGGTLDVTNGVLTVDRAMVDLGTLDWSYRRDGNMFVAYLDGFKDNAMGSTGVIPNAICSAYEASILANVYGSGDGIFSLGTTDNYAGRILLKDSRYTSASDFKTAVSGQTLCYELATPITYTLTPTEIKSLLGDNNIWADAGSTEVTYRADTAKYIDKKIAEVINALS